jgi:hypothetical protein
MAAKIGGEGRISEGYTGTFPSQGTWTGNALSVPPTLSPSGFDRERPPSRSKWTFATSVHKR